MQIDQKNIFPIMGEWLNQENSIQLDFSNQNADLLKLDLQSTPIFNDYVFGFLQKKTKNLVMVAIWKTV